MVMCVTVLFLLLGAWKVVIVVTFIAFDGSVCMTQVMLRYMYMYALCIMIN